jgi:hypothetical protein
MRVHELVRPEKLKPGSHKSALPAPGAHGGKPYVVAHRVKALHGIGIDVERGRNGARHRPVPDPDTHLIQDHSRKILRAVRARRPEDRFYELLAVFAALNGSIDALPQLGYGERIRAVDVRGSHFADVTHLLNLIFDLGGIFSGEPRDCIAYITRPDSQVIGKRRVNDFSEGEMSERFERACVGLLQQVGKYRDLPSIASSPANSVIGLCKF